MFAMSWIFLAATTGNLSSENIVAFHSKRCIIIMPKRFRIKTLHTYSKINWCQRTASELFPPHFLVHGQPIVFRDNQSPDCTGGSQIVYSDFLYSISWLLLDIVWYFPWTQTLRLSPRIYYQKTQLQWISIYVSYRGMMDLLWLEFVI